MNGSSGPGRKNYWVIAGQLTAVAFNFLGYVIAGVCVGVLGDRQFDTSPWLLIAFTLFGTSAGFYQMIRMVRHFEKHD